MSNVLIVDDNRAMCRTLARMLRKTDHNIDVAYTIEDARKAVADNEYDVVFLDVMMPDGNGLDLLPTLKARPSNPEVIIITGKGDPKGAEMAIGNGAWDYVEKGARLEAMLLPFTRAVQYRDARKVSVASIALRKTGIIGSSPQITKCLDVVAQAASGNSSVLITGETGTGKELFAHAVHANSQRCNGPLVVIDCAAIPEKLMESTLFGNEKGAYTGADRKRIGLIEQADGGTLFLDEVGELPLSLQKALLRVLQERRFRPVGGSHEVSSDFRLIAATNRDLDIMVEKGRFRHDLLFRLRAITIHLPPLRERQNDIKTIAFHKVHQICEGMNLPIKGFSPDLFEALDAYSWPGNVRELINTLERAVTLSGDDPILHPIHLPKDIRILMAQSRMSGNADVDRATMPFDEIPLEEFKPYRQKMQREAERIYLKRLMRETDNDIKKATSISGISQSHLYRLLKEHKLT